MNLTMILTILIFALIGYYGVGYFLHAGRPG